MIPQPIDQVPLFLRLAEDERELLSSRLRHLEFGANDVIFSAGKPAEMMAVIAQGWVKLAGDSPQGQARVALANLGAGSVIGDVDLLLNQPYSTTARAASTTHLLVLYRQDLQDLILERPTIGLSFSASLGARVAYLDEYLITQRLSGIPLLSALSKDELQALAGKLQFSAIDRGETLIEAGAPGDAIFLIEQGSVRLTTATNEGEAFEEYQAGEMIGHTAVITGKASASTARAVTDVQAWVLSHQDYQDLITAYPTIKVAFARALAETLNGDDQAKAVRQLTELKLFSDVETEALRDIAACLVMRHFPAGELVYAEGTPGDAMYLIESGRIGLNSDSGPDARPLETKIQGEAFGEMALLTGRTRAEAARAIEDTTVWVLYKSDYDDLIVRHPSLSLALSRALSGRLGSSESEHIEQQLNDYKLLNGLSQYELKQVGEYLKPLRFRPGETICFAGQNAQYIYLIKNGQVREIAGGPNGQAIVLSLLCENESFGERAVVQGSAYPTTMQAVGEVECLTLAKPDFERLLAHYPALALNLARRMADEAERAGQRQAQRVGPAVSRAPAPPPRAEAPRAVAFPGAPRVPASRFTPAPRAPNMSQPVPVQPSSVGVGVRTAPGKPWEHGSTSVVRPMPAANSRPIGMNGTAPTGVGLARSNGNGMLGQLDGLSSNTKIKLGVLVLGVIALVALVAIVLIFLVLSQLANAQTPSELPFNTDGTQRTTMAQMTGKLAMRERTATPTLAPATAVPTRKPTAKPVVKKVTPAPKAQVKPPTQESVPEAAPVAAAASVPIPPLPPRTIDPRLGPSGLPLLTGIGVRDANVPTGTTFWRITKFQFQDAGAESGNDHTIYITILDENGVRTDLETVLVSWDQSGAVEQQRLGFMDQKPKGDYCNCNYNWPMYGAGYRVRVDGSSASDEAYGMIMPEHRHVNYLLTFQKVIMP